jgi:hypothetical protein
MSPSAAASRGRAPARLLFVACVQLLVLPAAWATGNSPSGDVLFDQSDTSISGGASPTQQMAVAKDEIADDFEVTAAQGWTITQVKLDVLYTDPDGTPPGQPPYLLRFYPDDNGLPAATARCEYTSAPGVTDYPGSGLNVTVALPTPCVLPAGRYWMSMSPILEPVPYSLWGYNAPAAHVLNEPVYRNPDGYWGTGCVEWKAAYTNNCLFNPAAGKPNMIFQLLGTVGAGDAIFDDGFEPMVL